MTATLLALSFLCIQASASSAQVPLNTAAPTILGMAKVGQTLTASPGEWTENPGEFQYHWELCDLAGNACYSQSGFTQQSTYAIVPGNVGSTIRVQVIAVNPSGASLPAASNAVPVETAWALVQGPPRVEAASWRVACCVHAKSPLDKELKLLVQSHYCYGEPLPRMDRIIVRERPRKGARGVGSAVVTALVRFPAPLLLVGTVNSGEPSPSCVGKSVTLRDHVTLKRPIGRLLLFDGSRSPLRLVQGPSQASS